MKKVVQLSLCFIFMAIALFAQDDQGGKTVSETWVYKMETLAGTGKAGFGGDGGLAIHAMLYKPSGIALDKNGRIYIADYENNRVRMIDEQGIIHTIAGTGVPGNHGVGEDAKQAQLHGPYGVQIGPDNLVYIADAVNNQIKRIEKDGTLVVIAGNGTSGYSGDGGSPKQAQLSHPVDIAWDTHKNMYIAEGANNTIRKISQGIISTFAGTGIKGHSGDNGPAKMAQLYVPGALAFDQEDNLLVADLQNHRLRMITPDGMISTLAGNGEAKFNGDDIKAINATLQQPAGVAVLKDGSIIIADGVNFRIRLIDPDGIIHTIAGQGEQGFNGDQMPATKSKVGVLDILTTDDEGNIYFTDYGNHRIRKLSRVKVK